MNGLRLGEQISELFGPQLPHLKMRDETGRSQKSFLMISRMLVFKRSLLSKTRFKTGLDDLTERRPFSLKVKRKSLLH